MRKNGKPGLAAGLLLALLALLAATPVVAEEAAPEDEWTVLIYLCGGDMETDAGMASFNLHEIMSSARPVRTAKLDAGNGEWGLVDVEPGVNVLLQTGGAQMWRNGADDGVDWGLEVANDRLQRYRLSGAARDDGVFPLELAEELPLASMAEPQTLTDFIRWGAETCPAKKYMLVLWGHGGGSSTGLIIDELFDDDTMLLYELEGALEAAETHFEAVLLDACLMSGLETAWILAPYADWLVASEELASGYGTAFRSWLEELFRNPGCDGGRLGTSICDATQMKYSDMDDDPSLLRMTWAVTDLTRVEEVAGAFDALFSYIDSVYERQPDVLQACLARLFTDGEKLGTGDECMWDLGSMLSTQYLELFIDLDIRNALVNALDDAVVYTVNGSSRAGLDGLSFCYPATMAPERLDIYALNCKSAPFLAFLDAAVPGWDAPDWVYEQTGLLKPSEKIEALIRVPEQTIEDGLPVILNSLGDTYIWDAYYELYREDEETGELQLLGVDQANIDSLGGSEYRFSMDEPDVWPSIDGELCCIEFSRRRGSRDDGDSEYLYSIPIQLGPSQQNLIVGYQSGAAEPYRVYGLSPDFVEEYGAPSRSATPLAQLAGQEYELLYAIRGDGVDSARTVYASSGPLTLYRGLYVEEMPLPEGIYYCDYILENCLMRRTRTEMVKLYWDGTSFTALED